MKDGMAYSFTASGMMASAHVVPAVTELVGAFEQQPMRCELADIWRASPSGGVVGVAAGNNSLGEKLVHATHEAFPWWHLCRPRDRFTSSPT